MGFFGVMLLFIAFMRVMHWRRHFYGRLHYYGPHRYTRHHFGPHRCYAMRAPQFPVVEAPKPNAYEHLKQRYVRGDIEVEEYERALDEILRSPDGRRIVN